MAFGTDFWVLLFMSEDMNDFKTYKITSQEKQGIISAIRDELEKDGRIVFAYVYGSFVDPEMEFFRDIDIGIYVKDYRKEDWEKYELKLPIELEKKLSYKYPLDVKLLNNAEVIFAHNVICGILLLNKDEDIWADYVVYIAKRYNDFYPFWLHYMKEAVLSEDR